MRTPAIERDQVEGILNDLTRLNLGGRQVLGDRTNVEEAPKVQEARKKSDLLGKEIIDISSDTDATDSIPQLPKSLQLARLTTRACNATDNLALSGLVREFVEVLRINSSRTLTKEASRFLDALHKQLADPSVFVAPQRFVPFFSVARRDLRE